MRYESEIKPDSCPACGSSRVARIVYGKQKYNAEFIQKVESGEIVCGGCVIKDDHPHWQCIDCLTKIYSKPRNVSV